MATGDVEPVPGCTDLYYLDTGMYGTDGYGTVYLVDAERTAVVDPGTGLSRELVFEVVDDVLDGHVDVVLATHIHLDHAGGVGFLVDRHPEATAMTHEIGVPHLVDPERLVRGTKAAVEDMWEFYADPLPVPEDRIEPLTDGDVVDLGDRSLRVHHAPGHAPHQVVFHDDADDVLFAADAAGIWVPERGLVRQTTPPSNFDLEKCLDDVRMIEDLDPSVLCFGHFGPLADDVEGTLSRYKRALVEWVEAVRQKREEIGDDDAVVEYFEEHAELTEVWGERKARAEERLNTKGVLGYLRYVEDQ